MGRGMEKKAAFLYPDLILILAAFSSMSPLVTLPVSISRWKTHQTCQGQNLWCQNTSKIPSKARGPVKPWSIWENHPTFLMTCSNTLFRRSPSDVSYDITSSRKLSFPPRDWIRSPAYVAFTVLWSNDRCHLCPHYVIMEALFTIKPHTWQRPSSKPTEMFHLFYY